MKRSVRAEWIKMRRRWMPRILLVIMIAIVSLLLLATGFSNGVAHSNVVGPRAIFVAFLTAGFSSILLVPILAGAWSGNEYSWGTLRLVLTRRPQRFQQFFAGLIILAGFVAAMLLLAVFIGAVTVLIWGGGSGMPTGFWRYLLLGLAAQFYAMMFVALVAYAAGVIFRSAAAGIGLGIGLYIVENILHGIFFAAGGAWREISLRFPYVYSNTLPTRVVAPAFLGNSFNPGDTTPGIEACIIGIAVYSAILIGVTLVLLGRRDMTA